MAIVTVPSSSSGNVPLTFSNQTNTALAVQIAQQLGALQSGGSLNVVSPSLIIPPPAHGLTNELYLSAGNTGTFAVQSGYQYVVDNSPDSVTINLSPNTTLVGGGSGPATITGSGNTIVTGDDPSTGNQDVILSGSDTPYNVALGNGSNTVMAGGSGTIAGGLGANLLDANVGEPVQTSSSPRA
jgi:hypothetical protein